MLKSKIKTVGTISEFSTGAYKYKKIERKVNKKLIKYGVSVAVTIVAGSFLLNVSMPMAFANAMSSTEVVPVVANPIDSVKNYVSDVGAETLTLTVAKALDPLIQILKELARPIAGVMVTWGCLRYMIGQKEQGIGNIQQAAIGYILVMLSPMILNLITGVGAAIS